MLAFGGDLFGGCMEVLHVMVVGGGGGEEATPCSAHPRRQQPRKPPLGLVVVGTSSRIQLSANNFIRTLEPSKARSINTGLRENTSGPRGSRSGQSVLMSHLSKGASGHKKSVTIFSYRFFLLLRMV